MRLHLCANSYNDWFLDGDGMVHALVTLSLEYVEFQSERMKSPTCVEIMLQREKVLEEIIRVAEMNLQIVRMFKPVEWTKCNCDYCKQSDVLPDML
jgi:hypothetical protein